MEQDNKPAGIVYQRIAAELGLRERGDNLRTLDAVFDQPGLRVTAGGRTYVNFGSNDYLDLARDSRLAEASSRAALESGTGAAASRLLTGNLALDARLEARLAALYGKERALLFPTGYMTNLGIFAALAQAGDLVLADRLNHASILDGIRLSGADLRRFRHRDPHSLRAFLEKRDPERACFVVTDTVFSMDGDTAPLAELAALCREHDAFLIIDEAHANGVLGPRGLGLAEQEGLLDKIDLVMGTCSKALGSLGGFVAGDAEVISYLVNRAGSLIYTTGLPPAVLAATDAALDIQEQQPERRVRLLAVAARVRETLRAQGWDIMDSTTWIIPVLLGDSGRALRLAARLRDAGLLVPAIRPPTVPAGTARLRLSLSSGHTDGELELLLSTLHGLREAC